MTKKAKIYEYDPVLYPFRLWVTWDAQYADVLSQFRFLDEDCNEVEESEQDYNSHEKNVATTYCVADRKSCWIGCLVVVWKRSLCDTGICAHEASHITDFADEKFGLGGHTFLDGEPRAYLTQWVANCIDHIVKGKAE